MNILKIIFINIASLALMSISSLSSAQQKYDLDLNVTGSPHAVRINEVITYDASVSNISNVNARSVVYTQALPGIDSISHSQVDILSITASQGECVVSTSEPYVVTCELGDIPANSDAGIQINVDPRNTRLLRSEATVSAKGSDDNIANNFSEIKNWATTSTVANTDIGIVAHPVETIVSKKNLSYIEITLTNYGPETLYEVGIFGETSATSSADGFSITGSTTGSSSGCSIQYTIFQCWATNSVNDFLLPGESITGRIRMEHYRPGESTATFNLTGANNDTNKSNDSATTTIVVTK